MYLLDQLQCLIIIEMRDRSFKVIAFNVISVMLSVKMIIQFDG
jgi:hypothetical protein